MPPAVWHGWAAVIMTAHASHAGMEDLQMDEAERAQYAAIQADIHFAETNRAAKQAIAEAKQADVEVARLKKVAADFFAEYVPVMCA